MNKEKRNHLVYLFFQFVCHWKEIVLSMGDVYTPPLGVNEGSGNKIIPIDSCGTKRPTERIMPLRETLSDFTGNSNACSNARYRD